MKKLNSSRTILLHEFGLATAIWLAVLPAGAQPSLDTANQSTPIAMDQLGAVAGKQYQGDGLSVIATADGARLRCAFQHLDGQVTSEGLWLSSTAESTKGERFRVMAVEVGRVTPCAPFEDWSCPGAHRVTRPAGMSTELLRAGVVKVTDNLARFIRIGLTEEYSVSMDGVRQDFIVEQRPDGGGELRVELELTGARAEALAKGVRLVLDGSQRRLAYSRLLVVDARGQKLTARLEVADATHLAVVIPDAAAVYPVRIDPTFSDEDWGSMGGLLGADSFVNAAVSDGAGNLYIGGNFHVVGDVRANHIAKWNGSEWSDLSGGLDWDVWALAVSGSNLFVGGDFSWAGETETNNGIPVNRIAKWDGSTWSALGSGIGVEQGYDVWDYVAALAVVGTDVYAGGYFGTAGGTGVANIAKWNGSTWSPLSSGTDGDVYALAAIGTDLYAGGYFTTAGGTSAENIAKWDGNAWLPLGSGMDDTVQALAVMGTTLYAGGDFTIAGGNNAWYVARWNGSAWSPLGSGVDDRVTAFAVSGTDLYAGGWFSTAGDDTDAFYVAKWDGAAWYSLGGGVDDYVTSLAMVGSTLYVGGDFEFVGDKLAEYIAKWDGTNWSALGSGLSGYVYALAVSGTTLYAGGDFTTADVNPADNIAKWDGSVWSPLGSGMDEPVLALALSGTNLFVGGKFTTAGGTAVTHIAKWNGSAWSPLGSGMNNYGYVTALAVSGANLYAGGNFYTAGGTEASYVAMWDGSAWSPLGSGVFSSVNALAVVGTDLYAGGYLFIAKWDGSVWSPLGSEVNGSVYALAVIGSNLYVGGSFSTAGEIEANGIAQWNGNAWSALGPGVDGYIMALAVSGRDLYVGGYFTAAGGIPANAIARWDGSAWSALGSGMDASVYALAVVGTDLFAGGDFISAGNKVSAYAAKAKITVSITPALNITRSNAFVIVSWPVSDLNFQLQETTNVALPNSWSPVAQSAVTDAGQISVSVPTSVGSRFFRLESQ